MGLLLTLIASLTVWLVLWGTSLMKSFDAFLIVMIPVILAAAVKLVAPHLLPAQR
jgi:hypothetical protein